MVAATSSRITGVLADLELFVNPDMGTGEWELLSVIPSSRVGKKTSNKPGRSYHLVLPNADSYAPAETTARRKNNEYMK